MIIGEDLITEEKWKDILKKVGDAVKKVWDDLESQNN